MGIPVKPSRIGTDKAILRQEIRLRTKTRGRPRVSREIATQAIRAGYSTHHIARQILKCSAKTVRRIKREMIESGEINEKAEVMLDLEKIALEFDDECTRAVGISFFEWLKSRTIARNARTVFSFNRRVWTDIWGKASLVLARDPNNPLGDQLCMKFLDAFGDDKKRIRRRKKQIRYIFRFLRRTDLCDAFLTMSRARDPEEIREIPELTLLDFPKRLDMAFNIVRGIMGEEVYEALRFKVATQMRTGEKERELMGITVGKPNGSWILFKDEDSFRCEILAKGRERWIIEWLPSEVRQGIYRVYRSKKKGEHLFDWSTRELRVVRDEFAKACEEVGLPPLQLHDLRKVALTWLWAYGIDLAIATEINVGWKDLNTAKKHYLHMRELLKKSGRSRYRENIPEWFKDGLEEYLTFDTDERT